MLPGLVTRKEVRRLLDLLRSPPAAGGGEGVEGEGDGGISAGVHAVGSVQFDVDPDSVDGMPTHEIWIESPELYSRTSLKGDADPRQLAMRRPLRSALAAITTPILQERITPYVRQRLSSECGDERTPASRRCTPCYSFIR